MTKEEMRDHLTTYAKDRKLKIVDFQFIETHGVGYLIMYLDFKPAILKCSESNRSRITLYEVSERKL